ncbi:MAG: flagellar biosynthesis anti-sigma factor FlgM [Clostridiaceae bacterium]|nr:flagellar biosynthesis anti-sigma factor FlgM [Clostridiaceae bacterium]
MNIKGIGTQNMINTYNKNHIKSVSKTIINKTNDSIEISSLGKSLNNYSYDDYNIDNAKKIAEIKSKVESGTYNVDAKLTAKSMMSYMKENKY